MRSWLPAAVLGLAACATEPAPVAAPRCEFSAEDRAWIEASLGAWRFTEREITGVAALPPFDAVFFDDDCALVSANAFSAADPSEIAWIATPHAGEITLPDGEVIPAGVTAFAGAAGDRAFFVMSTPSRWRAAGVSNDALGLELMMTGVLLHEVSHVAQFDAYGEEISDIVDQSHLPDDDVNDDMIQHRFGDDAEFAASVQRETELLFQIVDNPSETEARRLARAALELMRLRRARWFVGETAYLAQAEDVWLTLEGSGQWTAYQWMVHPAGGGAESDAAMASFARSSRWWSQRQGIALAFAVDRLAAFDWKRDAFGGGRMTLTQMLEAALEHPAD